MPYNFVDDSCHTKKLCSRLSLSEVENVNMIAYTVLLSVGDMYATDDLGVKMLLWRPNL